MNPHASLAISEKIDGYVQKCNNSDINALARAISRCTYLPWNEPHSFSRYALPGETIITMHPSADGGMPHTRPPATICLPAYFPESRLEETLKHERVHIDQRNNYSKWVRLLEEDGWTPVDDEDIPAHYKRRCRINPDTCWSPFWAWNARYVPLPFFIREDKPDLREVAVRWYDLEEEILTSVVPISLVKKYGTLETNSLEHPFELMAYME